MGKEWRYIGAVPKRRRSGERLTPKQVFEPTAAEIASYERRGQVGTLFAPVGEEPDGSVEGEEFESAAEEAAARGTANADELNEPTVGAGAEGEAAEGPAAEDDDEEPAESAPETAAEEAEEKHTVNEESLNEPTVGDDEEDDEEDDDEEDTTFTVEEVDVLLSTNVGNLDAALATVDDPDLIREAKRQDSRKTSSEVYDERLAELEGE